MVASLAALGWFLPIFSFLLVFVLVYAVLQKTKVLGDNTFVSLMISFIFAIFFIVNTQLVEFVQINVAWIVVFFVCLFMILMVIAFTHGKVDVIMKPMVAWIILAILLVTFVVSSSYVFNWAINWDLIQSWFDKDWFGMVILVVIAAIVSKVLTGSVVPVKK
jgi:hypothetical protein